MRPRPLAGNLHPTPLAPIAGKDNQTALFSTPVFSARKRNFAPCQPLIASWLWLRQLADGRRWSWQRRPSGGNPATGIRQQRPSGRNSATETRRQRSGGRDPAAEIWRERPGDRDPATETRRQKPGGRSPAAGHKDSYQLTDGKLPRCCRCLYALPSPTLRLF